MQAIIIKPLTEALSKIIIKKLVRCDSAPCDGGLARAIAKVNDFSHCVSGTENVSQTTTLLDRVFSSLNSQKDLAITEPLPLSRKGDLGREAKALSNTIQVSSQEAHVLLLRPSIADSAQNTSNVAGKFVDHWGERGNWNNLELASLDITTGPAVLDAISLLKYNDICQILVKIASVCLQKTSGMLAYLSKAFDVTAPNHQLKLLFATIELAKNYGQDSQKSAIAQTLSQIIRKSQLMNIDSSGGAQYTLSYLVHAVCAFDADQHAENQIWSVIKSCASIGLGGKASMALDCSENSHENIAHLLSLKSVCKDLSFDIDDGFNAIADLSSLSDLPVESLTVSSKKAIKHFV